MTAAASDGMSAQPRGADRGPDPSTLTTQQLYREIFALRELIESRLDGNDRAIVVLQSIASAQPTPGIVAASVKALGDVVSVQIAALREFHEAKFGEAFSSIQVQFKERDVRVEQSSVATKIAVDAALQAAKEAVGAQNVSSAQAIAKSEAATTKQIDAIGTLIATQAKGVDDKIDDIKSRLQAMEGIGIGVNNQKRDSKDVFGYVVGAIGILISFLTIAGFVITNKG